MNLDTIIPILAVSGTLLLVLTGLLNFSVFLRQLRSGREQLETTRRLLENARQQPEIQLVQRAMSETSDHLRILVERPYLRPYFYENKAWQPGDKANSGEVKAMAELLLDNLASAIIHSAAFPELAEACGGRFRIVGEMSFLYDLPNFGPSGEETSGVGSRRANGAGTREQSGRLG